MAAPQTAGSSTRQAGGVRVPAPRHSWDPPASPPLAPDEAPPGPRGAGHAPGPLARPAGGAGRDQPLPRRPPRPHRRCLRRPPRPAGGRAGGDHPPGRHPARGPGRRGVARRRAVDRVGDARGGRPRRGARRRRVAAPARRHRGLGADRAARACGGRHRGVVRTTRRPRHRARLAHLRAAGRRQRRRRDLRLRLGDHRAARLPARGARGHPPRRAAQAAAEPLPRAQHRRRRHRGRRRVVAARSWTGSWSTCATCGRPTSPSPPPAPDGAEGLLPKMGESPRARAARAARIHKI